MISTKMRGTLSSKVAVLLLMGVIAIISSILVKPVKTEASTFPGMNGKIVFASIVLGNFEIYTVNPDGTGLTRLTNTSATDIYPSWSPDGTKIAFNSSGGIYVMNADGTGLTSLNINGLRPSWSPDGTKIVYARNDGIFVANSDGTGVVRLTSANNEQEPTWSPDGTKIVFVRKDGFDIENGAYLNIYVMSADGSNQISLTNTLGQNTYPSWSPDGTKIAFKSNRDGSGVPSYPGEIYVMNADGTGQTNLTNNPTTNDAQSAWSPDGTKITFSRDAGNIMVMNPDGTGQAAIAFANYNMPDWQPINLVNHAPVLNPTTNQTLNEGQILQFTVSATDPDVGDIVTLSANNLPVGASFDPQTGTFSWMPGFNDAGVYSGIEFIATDNGNPILSDSETITITVNDVLPLELTTIADSFLRQGQANRNEGANPHLFVQSAGHNRALSAFDSGAITDYVTAHGITSAKLILTIVSNGNNWGSTGRTIDAHPLLETFAEGNGKDAGLPGAQSTRGTGPGVTWNCATDTAIQDTNADCSPEWDGGTFGTPTASSVSIINGQTGEMEWDVTQDVLNSTFGWLIKKTNEAQNGAVEYYSKEGAADAGTMMFAPRLVLMP